MRYVVLCAVWLLAGTASAQTPSDTFQLAPVVVTATGVPTPADRLPVTTTVLRGADLQARGIRTVAEALRLVPGATVVETNSFGSQTSVFMRGGESDYTKVLIDGVPQNAPGGAYDFANLSTGNIDRIEVVAGPVSVLYGSDAVAGVVQIFTKRGSGPPHGTVSAHGGTYGSSDVGFSLGGGGRIGSYSIGGSRFSSDGSLPINNHYRNATLNGLFTLLPGDQTQATLSFRYGDALYHFPTDYTGAPTSKFQHQDDRGPSAALDLGHAFSSAVDVHLTGTWHRDNYQYAVVPNDSNDAVNLPYSSSDWVTRQGVQGRAVMHLPAGDVLTVGSIFEHQLMTGTTLGTPKTRDDGAGFVEVVTGLDRALSLTAGARLDDNQRFGTYGTYRAGLSYRLGGRTHLLASAGTAFKEPTLFQNYATGFTVGNPNLKPERVFSWEAGFEQTVGRSASVRATYFNQRFRQLIEYDGADSINYFNVPASWARGVEVGVHARAGAWGALAATYTYLQTRTTLGDTGSTALFLTGQPLIRRPSHSVTLSASAVIPGGGSVGAEWFYVGRRQDIDFNGGGRVTLPAYGRVDLSVQYPLAFLGGVGISGRVENVLDAHYQEVLSFPARGRTIIFGGSWTIGSH
jgi:vitamin B12 transporter